MCFPCSRGTVWLILQVFALARTHTLSWAACLRMIAAGAACATAIAAMEWLATGRGPVHGWAAFAGPVEEVAALIPVAAFWLAARHRFTRLAAVDYVLLGVASGAGFALVQGTIAALAAPGTGWHLAALLPGWMDAGPVRFPGHAVTTGLVTAGIGLAVAARPRGVDGAAARWRLWRLLTWLLPLALLGMAMLDHYHYDAAAAGAGVPSWVSRLHAAVGDGHASRWLLLVLLATAVAVDFRAQHRVLDVVPPLPGVPRWAGFARAARGSVISARLRWPAARCAAASRGAGPWCGWRRPRHLVAMCHEVAFLLVVARRRGRRRGVFAASLAFTRQRRELAMREARAGGRVSRDVPRRGRAVGRVARAHGVARARRHGGGRGAAAAGPARCAAAGGEVDPAARARRHQATHPQLRPGDLASGIGALHTWFSQFIPAGQVLIVAAGLSVLVLLASGWTAPVPLPSRQGGGPGRRGGRNVAVSRCPRGSRSTFSCASTRPARARRARTRRRVVAASDRAAAARQPRRAALPATPSRTAGVRPAARSLRSRRAPAVDVAPARRSPRGDELGRSGWLFPQDRVRRWLGHAPEFGVGSLKRTDEPADPAELAADLTSALSADRRGGRFAAIRRGDVPQSSGEGGRGSGDRRCRFLHSGGRVHRLRAADGGTALPAGNRAEACDRRGPGSEMRGAGGVTGVELWQVRGRDGLGGDRNVDLGGERWRAGAAGRVGLGERRPGAADAGLTGVALDTGLTGGGAATLSPTRARWSGHRAVACRSTDLIHRDWLLGASSAARPSAAPDVAGLGSANFQPLPLNLLTRTAMRRQMNSWAPDPARQRRVRGVAGTQCPSPRRRRSHPRSPGGSPRPSGPWASASSSAARSRPRVRTRLTMTIPADGARIHAALQALGTPDALIGAT